VYIWCLLQLAVLVASKIPPTTDHPLMHSADCDDGQPRDLAPKAKLAEIISGGLSACRAGVHDPGFDPESSCGRADYASPNTEQGLWIHFSSGRGGSRPSGHVSANLAPHTHPTRLFQYLGSHAKDTGARDTNDPQGRFFCVCVVAFFRGDPGQYESRSSAPVRPCAKRRTLFWKPNAGDVGF